MDGSHNVDGARALCRTLKVSEKRRIRVLLAMLEDKNYSEVARLLCEISDDFIVTSVDSPRACEPDKLKDVLRTHHAKVRSYDAQNSALEQGLDGLGKEDSLLVCGSLYFASQLRNDLIEAISRL